MVLQFKYNKRCFLMLIHKNVLLLYLFVQFANFLFLKFLNCNTDDTVLVRVYSSSVKTTKNQDVSDGTRVLPTLNSSSFKAFLIIIIK